MAKEPVNFYAFPSTPEETVKGMTMRDFAEIQFIKELLPKDVSAIDVRQINLAVTYGKQAAEAFLQKRDTQEEIQ